MRNQSSFDQVATHRIGPHFYRPAYESYCFSRYPDTIRKLFSLPSDTPLPEPALPAWDGIDNVIFFFADAIGWRFYEQFADHPFFRRLSEEGVVSQATAMFPSTTSAHTTCIHTGLPVSRSGIFEWYYYDPIVGEIISPLLFSLAGDRVNGANVREGLLQLGHTPSQLFPQETLYRDLAQAGIKSYVINNREYAYSSFSAHTNRGAQIVPYSYWPEALANLKLLLEQQPGVPGGPRRYFFLYYAAADSLMHQYGPGSSQVEAEILSWLDQMQRFVESLHSPRTLILISADHGQVETDPANSLAINLAYPELTQVLQRCPSGQPIRFGGSPRDLFLYVQPEMLTEVQQKIQVVLKDRGEVVTTESLMVGGVFGPLPVSERLTERLGNLVILPYPGEAVYWYEKDRFEQKFYGHHGGLSAQEMLIPLIAFKS